MSAISFCFTLQPNAISEFKIFFTSFKKSWDKQSPICLQISKQNLTLSAESPNEIIKTIQIQFQTQTDQFIEALILQSGGEELIALNLNILDFDLFVQMISNLDNNSKDVKFFLEKSDLLYLGCDITKSDETKIFRKFEVNLINYLDIEILKPQLCTQVNGYVISQIFGLSQKSKQSIQIQFYQEENQQIALVILFSDAYQAQAQLEIFPKGFDKTKFDRHPTTYFEINKSFISQLSEIFLLEEVISMGIHKQQLILILERPGMIKQFYVPQIVEFNNQQNENNGILVKFQQQ